MKEYRQMMEDQMKLEKLEIENQLQLESKMKELEKEMNKIERKNIEPFEEELIKDGFIAKGDNYEFELTAKHLYINGKKQPNGIFKKYSTLYEKISESKIKEDSHFYIKK